MQPYTRSFTHAAVAQTTACTVHRHSSSQPEAYMHIVPLLPSLHVGDAVGETVAGGDAGPHGSKSTAVTPVPSCRDDSMKAAASFGLENGDAYADITHSNC